VFDHAPLGSWRAASQSRPRPIAAFTSCLTETGTVPGGWEDVVSVSDLWARAHATATMNAASTMQATLRTYVFMIFILSLYA